MDTEISLLPNLAELVPIACTILAALPGIGFERYTHAYTCLFLQTCFYKEVWNTYWVYKTVSVFDDPSGMQCALLVSGRPTTCKARNK